MKACSLHVAFGVVLFLSHAGSAIAQESRQVSDGAVLYKQHCAQCHGADGRGGQGFATPIWGEGSQIKKFGHAGALYEYNQMLMPFNDPALMNDREKLAVVAYMLANHKLIRRTETIDVNRARRIKIP